MGADARIHIGADQKVKDAWPDADQLFDYIPTHYKDELCGIWFHHMYEGDGMIVYWTDIEDCYAPADKRARLQEFLNWLQKNTDAVWEVWT